MQQNHTKKHASINKISPPHTHTLIIHSFIHSFTLPKPTSNLKTPTTAQKPPTPSFPFVFFSSFTISFFFAIFFSTIVTFSLLLLLLFISLAGTSPTLVW